MRKKSIFQDYHHYYSKVTPLTTAKLMLKTFVLPVRASEKICPIIRLGMKHSKSKGLSDYFEHVTYKRFKCMISSRCEIDEGLSLPHPVGVVIGAGVKIGSYCTIYQNVTLGQSKSKYPVIGNHVILFFGAKVVGNVTIGDNVVVGANAVVVKDIPSNCVVAENPAIVIKENIDASDYLAENL